MFIWNEELSDIIEDGNARRGWFMELRREQDLYDIYLIEANREIEEFVTA